MEDNVPTGKARISLNGDFSATELDDILRELSKVRASLEPAVSMEPPTLLSEAEVLEQEDPLFTFKTLVSGGLRVWLRNEGFGWLAFTLNPAQVVGIREFLGKQAGHSYTSH